MNRKLKWKIFMSLPWKSRLVLAMRAAQCKWETRKDKPQKAPKEVNQHVRTGRGWLIVSVWRSKKSAVNHGNKSHIRSVSGLTQSRLKDVMENMKSKMKSVSKSADEQTWMQRMRGWGWAGNSMAKMPKKKVVTKDKRLRKMNMKWIAQKGKGKRK